MAKQTLVLSTVIIAIALLAPLFVAYAADAMRSYTVLEKKYSLAEAISSITWVYDNGTQSKSLSVDFAVDGDDIIIPSLPDPGDFSYTLGLSFETNATLLTPAMLWEAGVVKAIVHVEIPNTQSEEIRIQFWAVDPDTGSWVDLNYHELTPNATAWDVEVEYSTILLAKYASYTGKLILSVGETNTDKLQVGPGDYVVVSCVWYVSKAPFSAEQAELLLLFSGIAMMVCAAFATPYLSLKQLEALGRRRR